jgi:hypothetical protein
MASRQGTPPLFNNDWSSLMPARPQSTRSEHQQHTRMAAISGGAHTSGYRPSTTLGGAALANACSCDAIISGALLSTSGDFRPLHRSCGPPPRDLARDLEPSRPKLLLRQLNGRRRPAAGGSWHKGLDQGKRKEKGRWRRITRAPPAVHTSGGAHWRRRRSGQPVAAAQGRR